MNGLLNLLFPALGGVDAALGFLPAGLRVVAWGALSGALAMGLYALLANQGRIRAQKAEMQAIRGALAGARDDFAETMRLSKRNLAASLKLLGIVIGPAVLSSLPLLAVIAWLAGQYGYEAPAPGTPVPVALEPAPDGVAVEPPQALVRDEAGQPRLLWPAPGAPVRFVDAQGVVYDGPPPGIPATIAHKRLWWNWLWGNEAGYVRPDAAVEAISFALAPRRLVPGVPAWLGGWEAAYFLSVLVASLAIKLGFRIE